jgi:lysophospholipase L1-like esterase
MADVTANIVSTIEEIRLIAPEVDIVYCLYPNYANSALWKQFAGSYANLLVSGLTNVLKDIRRDFAKVPDILIMDMFGTFGDESLDDYLFDMVHFNNTGHQRCAEELFQLLGGTRVGPEPLGTEHSYGLFFAQP